MRLQNRRVLGSAVLTLGAALVLTGCGAGQITQTDRQQPAVNGASAQVGALYIRDAMLQFPPTGPAYAAGSSAALSLAVVNDGNADDELRSVSSDAADATAVQGSTLVVSRSSLVVVPSATAGQPPASTLPAAPAGAPPTSSPSPAAASPVQVGRAAVVLLGLKQPVWPGQTVRVTLVFRNAGPVTIDLPVGAPGREGASGVHTEAALSAEGH